jgi:uncharacterized OB-fold protein
VKVSPIPLSREKERRYRFLGKIGRVISFTSIAVAPQGLEKRTPYVVAVVDFGGKRATSPIADVGIDGVKTGMEVMGVLRRMQEPNEEEVIVYGVKCIPIRSKE